MSSIVPIDIEDATSKPPKSKMQSITFHMCLNSSLTCVIQLIASSPKAHKSVPKTQGNCVL